MSRQYSESEIIQAVARLTTTQLRSFVEAEIITPTQTESGIAFQHVDIVRLELLCELSEEFDMPVDALGIVISLIDQLHGARASLRTLLEAVENEPKDVRDRIQAAIRNTRPMR